jgi:predicted RNase H-like nuclease (RuvC/YqgF family)
MNSNGHQNELERLLGRVDALKDKIEDNPAAKAALDQALAGVDMDDIRKSARQKVLKERGIEPRTTAIDRDWLEEQLQESRIDRAMLLVNAGTRTMWMNTQAAFKALGLAVKIVWRALLNRRVRGRHG